LTTQKVLNTARRSAEVTGTLIGVLLRGIGTVLIIILLSGLIFACIFTVYVKNNLSSGLDIRYEDVSMNLSSIIYYIDPETGEDQELGVLQSTEYRKWVNYDEIPINMEHALIAVEDKRFYEHNGVDWFRTAHAFVYMFLNNDDTFGGSTITQQLIKNLTGNDEVTITRKLTEIFSALEFEKENDKTQIVEWYLNKVYFGSGCYGIGAAADYYFDKEIGELTLAECADIIGITNNPSMFSPYVNRTKNKDRQEDILNKMYAQGYISLEELETAKAQTLVFRRGENTTYQPVIYSWFEEAVRRDVIDYFKESRGLSSDAAEMLLYNGGFKIYSTINPQIQAAVDEVYQDIENLPKVTEDVQKFPDHMQQVQSAITIIDPYTGDIVAMAGGVGVKDKNLLLNRATSSPRQPGSSIKPLTVYSPAMDLGLITPKTKMADTSGIVLSGNPNWYPHNDDFQYMGTITIRTAVIHSRNTIAAQVMDKLTPAVSYKFAREKLGLSLSPRDEAYAPLALGGLTVGLTTREMASAYTMFDNGGVRIEGRTFSKICDDNGNLVYDNKPVETAAIKEATAYWMTSILADAATIGTGKGANLGTMPTAGKTGTTSDDNDRWFVGFTPYYVAAVWTGFDTPSNMNSSGNPASAIWKRVMTKVHADLPYREFPTPEVTYVPPVEGIKEIEYTVHHRTPLGTVFYTETKYAELGSVITEYAPTYEGFSVSDATVTITINENPSKNLIEFIYKKITSPTPPPAATTPNSPPGAQSPQPPSEPSAQPPETQPPSEPASEAPPYYDGGFY
jgi:penicillin-binding protein 1A